MLMRPTKLFKKLETDIGNRLLSEYFNISPLITIKIKEPSIHKHNIIIQYGDILKIKIDIDYPNDYPFTPPKWVLKYSIFKEEFHSFYLSDYYQYIINTHNNQYDLYWSPVIMLEKDILIFVTRINHFEYILENAFLKDNKIRKHFKYNVTEELMSYVWNPKRFNLWKNYDTDIIDLQ